MRQIHGSARPSSKLALPMIFTRIGASCQAHLQPADAPPGACFHQSTHCENALAALYAGVVYPLHPLAGVDSARLLLFSGNAISYMSNCRTQCTLRALNCLAMFLCSTASLLYPCWVARVSRLIGNSDSTAKAHHWQGGSAEGSGRPKSHERIN
jgi:hypothetical protein